MNTSLRKNQQGLAHVALILVAVAALAAIGFVGYRVLNKDKKSSSSLTTQEAKEIEAECKAEIDDKDFCKFATNFAGVDDYTAVLETSGANGAGTVTMKTKGDSSQLSTTSDGVVMETISIGNTTYIKDPSDNKWTKYTSEDYKVEDVKEDIKIDFDESDKPEAERTQYKKVGKEDCGKLTCFKYQIIDPANTGEEQFIWFDDNDYLLRKWTFTGGEGTTTATFTYGGVNIKEPSPVKEPTSPADGPSEEEIKALMEQYGQ